MIVEIIILIILIFVYLVYRLYFKDYFQVKNIYESLKSFLDTRDTLVLKLVPEIDDKEIANQVVMLIEERRENFKTSYNNSIKADVKLNSELRKFYEVVNKVEKNDVINSIFRKVLNLEKDLKKLRNEYTMAVEKYNNNLVKHKFISLKVIKMKPLDTYSVKK